MATKPTSVVFSHFELPSDVTGKYKAKCNHCSLYISSSGKTTSNLLTHLKRKHPSVLTNKIVKEVPENQPSIFNYFFSWLILTVINVLITAIEVKYS